MEDKNNENYVHLMNIILTEDDVLYPIAFANKVQEMMGQDLSKSAEDANKAIKDMNIKLKLYYHKDYGFFAVDDKAIKNNVDIFPPTLAK